jgi:hypothetical protein
VTGFLVPSIASSIPSGSLAATIDQKKHSPQIENVNSMNPQVGAGIVEGSGLAPDPFFASKSSVPQVDAGVAGGSVLTTNSFFPSKSSEPNSEFPPPTEPRLPSASGGADSDRENNKAYEVWDPTSYIDSTSDADIPASPAATSPNNTEHKEVAWESLNSNFLTHSIPSQSSGRAANKIDI